MFKFRFTDYGNESLEDECNIVGDVTELPPKDLVDEHVYITDDMPKLTEHVDIKFKVDEALYAR